MLPTVYGGVSDLIDWDRQSDTASHWRLMQPKHLLPHRLHPPGRLDRGRRVPDHRFSTYRDATLRLRRIRALLDPFEPQRIQEIYRDPAGRHVLRVEMSSGD
ncbi:hypothetical protein FNH05_09660 [Amycolatopsis rhizosphaerae]|uniref:Uncharacterized protein n=1 Tax=Amycolatopsis rhizosphaerae TaxID=2053003 RepID=A0A558D2U6_9PSEU|nr:hypothetical protein [Amycolatopsis rhizosphaerae]TVT55316.1 hypothetical protein FNH05_09660 [Amycolatopsis rhizosphaerae]